MKRDLMIATTVLLALGLLFSCVGSNQITQGSSKTSKSTKVALIASVSPVYGVVSHQGSELTLTYTPTEKGLKADSAVLFVREHRIGQIDTTGYRYKISTQHPTGRVGYRIELYNVDSHESRSGEFTVMAATAPTLYGHKVIHSYPHDTDAYTQGLLFHNGALYESTGLEKRSSLRRVEPATGRVTQQKRMDNSIFAEGLTLLNNQLYQLTWHNNKCFVYDLQTFEPVGEFTYGGEGWGLATDGKLLYMSDGSHKIQVLDPKNFNRVRTIEVYTNQSKVLYINEMEWINGELWANVYTTDTIIRIDPQTGAVIGVVDLAGLLPSSQMRADTDVLNGIAYDSSSNRIFVTGKNWPTLFEIITFKK